MLKIKKEYVVSDKNRKKAVLIDIETFEKVEELLEDYGLGKYMEEVEDEEILSIHGAKRMKIFIAHASENKAFAERLAKDLLSRGYLVWFDKWEVKVGDSIVDKINEGIDTASFMIVVLSKHSVNKQWVKEEMNAGFIKGLNEKSVYLLPVLLEKCDVPSLLADKKYANFSSNYDDGLAELLSSL